jgi:hypothetical protein
MKTWPNGIKSFAIFFFTEMVETAAIFRVGKSFAPNYGILITSALIRTISRSNLAEKITRWIPSLERLR